MELRPLTKANMEQVRVWRLGVPECLRTPYMLTEEMQQDYYKNVICNRQSTTRYWGLWVSQGDFPEESVVVEGGPWGFIGYGGIENVSWENGNGEMSLLLGPDYRGKGYGKQAVGLFLDQAFNHLRLEYVYGECYACASWRFWERMLQVYKSGFVLGTQRTWLPARKFYKGEYHDSYYFTFTAKGYRDHTSKNREQSDTAKEH